MNIFKYDGKEFEQKLEEIFNKINSKELLKELISCGLEVNDEMRYDYEQSEYSNYKEYNIYVDNDSTSLFKNIIRKLTGSEEKNDIKEAA